MLRTLARRGPDSEGIERLDEAVLGHRRLAIFDLSDAGHQPMISADGSVSLVFNGAIYNYRELRRELISLGCSFRSNTDTEVILHGYREWGIEKLLAKLSGMFAFGLWNSRNKTLYLVRDRLGVKPLVFVVQNKLIAFASTVRALRAARYVDEIDANAVIDFLQLGFVRDDNAIYHGAIKVSAGAIIEWHNGNIVERKYWAPPVAGSSPAISFHEAVEHTEHLLLKSVEARLQADVPVGVLLSSGIDSALVCWAITRLGADISAYTVGTPGDPWDEARDASTTARLLGIRHRILEMSEHDVPDIDDLVSAYAEPFACASALGMLKVSRAITNSVKVLLTGDGGDDIYLGYPEHRHLWLAEKLSHRLPPTIRSLWSEFRWMFPRIGPLRRAAALLDYSTLGLDAFVNGCPALSAYKTNGLLGDRLLQIPVVKSNATAPIAAGSRVLYDFFEYHLKTRFVGEYMTKVDGGTMHYGLEARSPFLDHRLWEFAASLPFDLRLHGDV
jgi:asparagine synthase (glutamine-hydrolysing)